MAAVPELLSWADCELLADKSEEAAADDADRALELAELALWVAERVPGEAVRLQCQGWSWAIGFQPVATGQWTVAAGCRSV